MSNPWDAPEITVHEVAAKIEAGEPFVLLDVRETWELDRANLNHAGACHAPLSALAERQLDALPTAARDPHSDIVVFCHHGVRSAQCTAWLRRQGYDHVRSMAGGIDAYAAFVDPSVGVYD